MQYDNAKTHGNFGLEIRMSGEGWLLAGKRPNRRSATG